MFCRRFAELIAVNVLCKKLNSWELILPMSIYVFNIYSILYKIVIHSKALLFPNWRGFLPRNMFVPFIINRLLLHLLLFKDYLLIWILHLIWSLLADLPVLLYCVVLIWIHIWLMLSYRSVMWWCQYVAWVTTVYVPILNIIRSWILNRGYLAIAIWCSLYNHFNRPWDIFFVKLVKCKLVIIFWVLHN